MIGRGLSRLLVAIALVCASVAWTGWVVLHTIADPSRSARIAHAVLDDPQAREQIAGDLSSSLAEAVNAASASAGATTGAKVPRLDGDDPTLNAAMLAAISDQRVVRNLVDAFTAEHANILGADPKQDASIDTAVLIDALGATLGSADPALAARISAAAPKSVKLPDIEIPFAAEARDFASSAVPRLAGLSAILIGLALAIGHRPTVLRRVGIWGITAGLLWVLVPRALVWAAERWAPGNAAVVRALLEGATGVVSAMAVLLVIAGIGCVVLGMALDRMASARSWARRRQGPPDARSSAGRDRAPAAAATGAMHPGWRPFTGRDLPPPVPPPNTAPRGGGISYGSPAGTAPPSYAPPSASPMSTPPARRAPAPRPPSTDATTVFETPPGWGAPTNRPADPAPWSTEDPTTVFAPRADDARPARRPHYDPSTVFEPDEPFDEPPADPEPRNPRPRPRP